MRLYTKVTTADYDITDPNMVDDIHEDAKCSTRESIPRINGAEKEMPLLDRTVVRDSRIRVPMHVLFNQAARMCTRFNKIIRGTRVQQYFVQKLVSTIYGYSFPILYFHSMLFPKHFWSNFDYDKIATLGCAPISCFRKAFPSPSFLPPK